MKFLIEIPKSFYQNLTNNGQNPLELWHPRLILSPIKANSRSLQENPSKIVGKGRLKEKVFNKIGATSFLQMGINNEIQGKKMSCACRFSPFYEEKKDIPKENQEIGWNLLIKTYIFYLYLVLLENPKKKQDIPNNNALKEETSTFIIRPFIFY